jgi:hypothetical protein
MNQVDKDDFAHALGMTLEFFGKKLERTDFSFWYSALGDRGVESIKRALKEYVKVGKYAPRPANIVELMSVRTEHNRLELPSPPPTTNCSPEIAKAWMWFIGQTTKGTKLDGIFSRADIPVETQERYLHLVNHEAQKNNQPEAIPDEYKLAEVWA